MLTPPHRFSRDAKKCGESFSSVRFVWVKETAGLRLQLITNCVDVLLTVVKVETVKVETSLCLGSVRM